MTSLHLFGAWRSPAVRTALAILPRAAPWVATLAALTTLGVGLLHGSRVAGASDPTGYVSQADLWLHGDLKVAQPPVGELPWPERQWTFSPLGYRPTEDGRMLVPTYAPEWIDRAIEHFRRAGRPVYVLLDDWEVPVFAERFLRQNAGAVVRALAATRDGRVLLFATEAPGAATSPVQMPRTRGCLPRAASKN